MSNGEPDRSAQDRRGEILFIASCVLVFLVIAGCVAYFVIRILA
jgi:hypothetical protein